jgi:dienelactone hydrolase
VKRAGGEDGCEYEYVRTSSHSRAEACSMIKSAAHMVQERLVGVPAGRATLNGDLRVPEGPRGIVLFAHGSGSGRHSSRNRHVAWLLNEANLTTLLIDLLTPDEEAIDLRTAHLRFDISLLANRLVSATDWLSRSPSTGHLPIGYFGASTGAAAALVAAASVWMRCARSYRAAGVPIWPERHWPAFGRPHCSLSAAMMSRSSS